ncbi:MAG: PDZ domain-containing protein [Ignavibacteriales bacterium]|nr:PDZ domain-containing protein [Ignavibacteriales bacterium]
MKRKIVIGGVLLMISMLFMGAAYRGMFYEVAPQEKSERSQQGWLGVSTQTVDSYLKKSKGLKNEEGAYVTDVVRDSPAYSAGIKEEDVITEVNGKSVGDVEDLQRAISKTKPGTKVSIAVMRDGEKKNFEVTIGKPPRRTSMSFGFGSARPRIEMFGGTMYGLGLKALNEQLGEYFGVPEGKGVLVEEVEKNSTADKAGFKAGDVITQVGKKHVDEVWDITRALNAYDDGEKVDVEVFRKGSKKTLTLEVNEDEDHVGNGFWFNGTPSPHRLNEFRDLQEMDFDIPNIEIGRIRPDLDELRLNLDELKNNLRGQQFELRRKIERDSKPRIRIRVSNII